MVDILAGVAGWTLLVVGNVLLKDSRKDPDRAIRLKGTMTRLLTPIAAVFALVYIVRGILGLV